MANPQSNSSYEAVRVREIEGGIRVIATSAAIDAKEIAGAATTSV